MISINASEAQSRLYDLIEEASLSHKPLIIAGNKSNAAGSNGFCGHRRQPPIEPATSRFWSQFS